VSVAVASSTRGIANVLYPAAEAKESERLVSVINAELVPLPAVVATQEQRARAEDET